VTVFLLVGAAAALWRLAGMPAAPPDAAVARADPMAAAPTIAHPRTAEPRRTHG
jgi:hypothetical protein